MRSPSRIAGSLSAAVVLAVLSAPAPAAARTVIGATPLGMSDEIVFHGRTDEVAFPIPVPEGLTPKALATTVQTPVDMARGFLEAWSGNLLLARVALPGDQEFVQVEVPLERAAVREAVADVTLRTVLTSDGQACPDWTQRSLELRDSEVIFDGEPEVPEVLADFIPPVLERLEIYLPYEPSTAEAEAAANLAVMASSRFGARGLEVEVLSLDGPRAPEAPPFTRRVEIREDETTRVDLLADAVPTVAITGDAGTLRQQAQSVTTQLRRLAVTGEVTVDAPSAVPRGLISEATLDDLGTGSVSARGIGTVTAAVGLDKTRLAAVTGDVTVDLVGMYTPPPNGRSGLVVVSAGDAVVDSWVADQSGTLDKTVVIPGGLLGRYTDVAVSLQTSGEGSACGLEQPLSMLISGQTRLRIDEPPSPAPRGFESLPQALMPRLQVAAGAGSLADTARAITILSGLQALSVGRLWPEWVSVDDLLDSDVPGLLVSSSESPTGLPLPLELTGGRTLTVVGGGTEEPASLRFYEDIDFAALQVVEDGDRAVLVAESTSGSAELDRTLAWLDAEPDRWSSLRGNVLFTAPGREPIQLSTTDALSVQVEAQADSDDVDAALIVGSAAAVAGVALAGILWLATRRGRSGRRS